VTTWGLGPDVVLLHGLGASNRYWETLLADSQGYRATAPDLLGFGLSPTPSDAPYDVDCHLDALLDVLPPNAVVVAHSTGAILAAALAARHPGRVRSLLLLGLPAYANDADARREVGRLGALARLTVAGRPSARWICQAMCRHRSLAVAVAPFLVRDLPAAIASDGARHSWASYHRTLEAVVVHHRVLPDLLTATCPVTLLHGGADATAPVADVEALVDVAARQGRPLDLHIVDGGDHHLAVRRSQLVARAVARLIKEP